MSKQSKSNPEKGQRTVSIDFGGKQRTLKFGHEAIGNFEAEANDILRSQKAIESGNMVFAEGIMTNWIGNAKIFSMALRYGLIDDMPDNIGAAIDSFIENGGSKLELTRAIITAYRYATNPSTVASLKRSWQISDERQTFLTEAENQAMDSMETAIQDAKAKQIIGSQSTASES
jgi:hypothetical protein